MRVQATEQELHNLSPEERAALEDSDDEKDLEAIAGEDDADDDKDDEKDESKDDEKDESKDDEKDDAKEGDEDDAEEEEEEGDDKDGGAEDDKDDDKSDDKDESKDEGKEGDKPKGKGDEADDGKAAADDTTTTDEPFVPRYQIPQPEKYDERMKELADAKDALQVKFKAGDIELEDMLKERDALDTKRQDLRDQKLKADMAAEQDRQSQEQRWFWEVDRFIRDVRKADGVDLKGDKKINATWDATVKVLATDPANKDQPSEWFLKEAYEITRGIHRLGDGKPAPKEGEGKEKPGDKKKPLSAEEQKKVDDAVRQRRTDPTKVPKTLSKTPAAGDEDSADSEFSDLDKLDGMELEAALARLPKDKADRYLSGK